MTPSVDDPPASRVRPSPPSVPTAPTASAPGSCRTAAGAVDPARLLALLGELGRCADFDAAAATLCSRVAPAIGAARVVLGWRSRGRAPTRPIAMSGAGVPQWDGETARRLSTALDESIDQARALACPAPAGHRTVLRAHESLRRAHGVLAVMTVPVAHDGVALGALCAEFDAPPPPGALDALTAAASTAAPWLRLLAAHRPGPVARALAALGLSGRPGGRASRRARWIAAAGAIALLAALTVPIELSVSAPARIEGEVQRAVAAPIRGYLKAVHVRPGDAVREGDLLAELGDRDLELERAKLRSELGQHAAGVTTAMARGDRGAMAIAQSRHDEVRARLGLIEHQLEQIRVRAPIDGEVIQGDLVPKIGAPVDRGQELFVVAPALRHRVIVELDERDLRRVATGQPGRLAVSALPWETMPLRVERVAPAAITLDGRNVFELEAGLTDRAEGLRPGQRGVVHLDAGRGPVGLHWARRVGDALARLAWRWTP